MKYFLFLSAMTFGFQSFAAVDELFELRVKNHVMNALRSANVQVDFYFPETTPSKIKICSDVAVASFAANEAKETGLMLSIMKVRTIEANGSIRDDLAVDKGQASQGATTYTSVSISEIEKKFTDFYEANCK